MVDQLQLWERPATGIVGLAGKTAGPLQAALLRQQDAGRPVSDQQLLLAAARDQGCRVTCRQYRGTAVPTGGGAPLSPPSPAEQARARSWAEALFWREVRKNVCSFGGRSERVLSVAGELTGLRYTEQLLATTLARLQPEEGAGG